MKKNITYLIDDMPKAIGVPERIVFYDKTKLLDYVNLWNGKKRIFLSLYNVANPQINKLWFDFDSEDSFKNMLIMHNYCNEHNYRHIVVFSGGGFHLYIYTKNYENLVDKKMALKLMQEFICKEC